MFKLNVKFDVDSLLYSLSHFEWDGHTVHMLTQQHLPPPMSDTIKSSLFTHKHSSPRPLAASLHWCHTNHSHYMNNGWTFSGQTWIWITLQSKLYSGVHTMLLFLQFPWLNSFDYWSKWLLKRLNSILAFHFFFLLLIQVCSRKLFIPSQNFTHVS